MYADIIKKRVFIYQLPQTILLLAVSIILPFFMHLFPSFNNIPLGVRFIPMFYGPFLAVIFLKKTNAFFISLVLPILNFLFTSHPESFQVFPLTVELFLFVLCLSFLSKIFGRFLGWGIFSYVISCFISSVINYFWITGVFSFLKVITISLPGIFVLQVIDFITFKHNR